MPKKYSPSGLTRERRAMAEVLAESTICAYCGHDGADSVDHVEPKSLRPDLAADKDNMVPAHMKPCPTCLQRCNRIKGTKPVEQMLMLQTSRNWFGVQ